jgi:hypothetical protein
MSEGSTSHEVFVSFSANFSASRSASVKRVKSPLLSACQSSGVTPIRFDEAR